MEGKFERLCISENVPTHLTISRLEFSFILKSLIQRLLVSSI